MKYNGPKFQLNEKTLFHIKFCWCQQRQRHKWRMLVGQHDIIILYRTHPYLKSPAIGSFSKLFTSNVPPFSPHIPSGDMVRVVFVSATNFDTSSGHKSVECLINTRVEYDLLAFMVAAKRGGSGRLLQSVKLGQKLC